jgi:putative transposase
LDPNASRLPLLHSRPGAARAAYNWAVARVSGNWRQRAAEESYGLAGDELTPWQGWSLPAFRKSFTSQAPERDLAMLLSGSGRHRRPRTS